MIFTKKKTIPKSSFIAKVKKGLQIMEKLLKAIEDSLGQGNQLAAMYIALTLPDVCGKIMHPDCANKKAYVYWCDKYFAPKYLTTKSEGIEFLRGLGIVCKKKRSRSKKYTVNFLKSETLYQFRCSLLHGASQKVELNKKGKPKVGYIYEYEVTQEPEQHAHIIWRNLDKKCVLQLNVKKFCDDMCSSVREWISDQEEPVTLRLAIPSKRLSADEPPQGI